MEGGDGDARASKDNTCPQDPDDYELGAVLFWAPEAQTKLPDTMVRKLDHVNREKTMKFSPKCPSIEDMKLARVPKEYCVKEREWLRILPVDLLHLETMWYLEMARLGLTACLQYGAVLEEKCRWVESGELDLQTQKAMTKRGSAKKENEELLKEKARLKEKLKKVEQESLSRASEIKKLKSSYKIELDKTNAKIADAQANSDTKIANAQVNLEKALKDKDDLGALLNEKEDFVANFTKSNIYKTELVRNIYPHWCYGMRIGVFQTIEKYEADNPLIVYFEPDYTKDFGESNLQDSDDEAKSSKAVALE